ncbi:Reverse transcriptase/retrotransposon-derived protein [Theobroma cacao]|nr:Reverse transcriptase/retrotransposon-derived protein [Theobroma cacao]
MEEPSLEEVDDELEIFNNEEIEEVSIDHGEALVVRCNLNTTMMIEDEIWLRHNIFHTRCTSQGKVCNVIIDSGSCENVVANYMVKKLKLSNKVHLHPYKLQWLRKGNEVKVTKRCCVQFSIENKYEDEVCSIATPLTECLKQDSFIWNTRAQHGFEELKERITKAPVLALLNFDLVFEVDCDASNVGIGVVLSQEGRPIAFFTWSEFFQAFPILLKHKSSAQNKVADALSRRLTLLSTLQLKVVGFEVVKELYEKDPEFGKHIRQWDLVLAQAKFSYNNFVSQTTGRCSFEVIYGKRPLSPLNLPTLPTIREFSADAEERVKKECFPKSCAKLSPRADGPFRVLERINENAYKIELLGDYEVFATFNVVDLSPYYGEHDEDMDLEDDFSPT